MTSQVRDSIDHHVQHWVAELPQLDPVHEAIIARLLKVSRYLAAHREDAFAASELSRASFKILLALRRLGPPYTARPSELADYLGLSRGALSARLGPMEDAGWITRSPDSADRRQVHVQLTPLGSESFATHAQHESTHEAALLDSLPRADQTRLADVLRQLVLTIESGN